AEGEQAIKAVLPIVEAHVARNRWMLGAEFSLVDCAYCPILHVVEKAGFSFADFPQVSDYLARSRARPAWQQTPKLPFL
ncbi:MAG: glutathione S-transferase family protein, partial [Alphaproteobacteria bacterium]|nr:glutathione S-transferase family protein [Alphaproteobacteria bacterium]